MPWSADNAGSLKAAHAEIRAAFLAPGAQIPAEFDAAMQDELWASLVRARAASNRYHARLAARHAGLAIHHGANDAS